MIYSKFSCNQFGLIFDILIPIALLLYPEAVTAEDIQQYANNIHITTDLVRNIQWRIQKKESGEDKNCFLFFIEDKKKKKRQNR